MATTGRRAYTRRGAPIFIFKHIVNARTPTITYARGSRYITRVYKREWWIDSAVDGMRFCAFDDYWSIFPNRLGTKLSRDDYERFGDLWDLPWWNAVYLHTRSSRGYAVLRRFLRRFVFPKMHKRRDGEVPARQWIAAACIPQASPRTADSPCAVSPSP